MNQSKRKFPGFDRCMELMRKHDPVLQEEGFGLLMPHAQEYVCELITEFGKETDHGLRCWLFELIAEAKAAEAFPLLVEALRSDDDTFWTYAIYGLKKLETSAARQILWQVRSYIKSSQQKTQYFRKALENTNC